MGEITIRFFKVTDLMTSGVNSLDIVSAKPKVESFSSKNMNLKSKERMTSLDHAGFQYATNI